MASTTTTKEAADTSAPEGQTGALSEGPMPLISTGGAHVGSGTTKAWLEAGTSDVLVKQSSPKQVLIRLCDSGSSRYIQRSVPVFDLFECLDWKALVDSAERNRQDAAAAFEEHTERLESFKKAEQRERWEPSPTTVMEHEEGLQRARLNEARHARLRDALRYMQAALT